MVAMEAMVAQWRQWETSIAMEVIRSKGSNGGNTKQWFQWRQWEAMYAIRSNGSNGKH